MCWIKEENLRRKVEDRELKIRTYCAGSPHKSELADINTHWQDFDVVMYTSTITVAVHYMLPVHRAYCFPDVFASPPRDTLQGSGDSEMLPQGKSLRLCRSARRGALKRFYFPLPEAPDMNLAMQAELEKVLKVGRCRVP